MANSMDVVAESMAIEMIAESKALSQLTGMDIAEATKAQLAVLTGLTPDTVSGLSRTADGWLVTVELIELSRIPPSTDVLATYEVLLDDAGNVLGYERIRRYYRGQALQQES